MPPLALAALAIAAGLLAAFRHDAAPGGLLLLGFAACAAWLLIQLGGQASRVAAFLLVGFAAGQVAAEAVRRDCRIRLPDGAVVTVRGWLEAAPAEGAATNFKIAALLGENGWTPCEGTVRARLRGQAAAEAAGVAAGSELTARGRWWALPHEGPWLRLPQRAGTMLLDSVSVAPAARRAAPLLARRGEAQLRIRALFPQQSALAEALILAQRDALDPAVRERFTRSGLPHLLAISGLHVGLIAGTLLLLGRLCRLSPRPAASLAAVATLGYVLFLGAPHAAARAALQVLLVLSARMLQRPADPFALLAAAALVLLGIRPLAVLDPGFQLSFAGTAGIIALRRRFLGAFSAPWLPRYVGDSLATTLAATLATAPIAVLHFNRIAPVGILANLLATPLVALVVPAIATTLLASYVAWPLATFIAPATELLLGWLDAAARLTASVPGGHLYVTRGAMVGWAAAATAAAFVAGFLAARGDAHGRRASREPTRRRWFRRAVAGMTALALLVAWPVAARRMASGLEIHAIDVGQGDAFAIRSPAGRWILVDTGPGGGDRFDAGRARVVPFLLRHGVRRLEAIILTHPHSDHIGGTAAVLDAIPVGMILDPGVPFTSPVYFELLQRAQRDALPWFVARAGRELRFDGLSIQLLHPEDEPIDAGTDPNDYSIAFRLVYGEFAALFLGDAPAAVEEALARRYGDGLRAQLLKVSHHGSRTSTSPLLLAVVEPELAIVPVGERNRFGHPDPTVIGRLNERNIHVLRTDLHGTISVRVAGPGALDIETARSPPAPFH